MRTHWPDDSIMDALSARDPQDEQVLAGSEHSPEARALLCRVLAVDPAERASGDGRTDRRTPPVRRVRRRRFVVGGLTVAGLGAALAVALVVTSSLPGSPIRPRSAAAAVLDQAAVAAAQQPPSGALGRGQYLYSETSIVGDAQYLDLSKTGPIYVEFQSTVQKWIARDGSGREVDTYAGPGRFLTPASERNWVAAGSPAWVLAPPAGPGHGGLVVATTFGPTGSPTTDGPAPFDVSGLPTDPSALLRAIEAGRIGPANLKDEGPRTKASLRPWLTFYSAIGLLTVPEVGVTPRFRAAVFHVMAGLPGVRLLGPMADATGRRGIGLALPDVAGEGTRVIVDPGSGRLLEFESVVTDPSAEPPAAREYFGTTAGLVTGRTVYLGSGIVDSPTQVPLAGASTTSIP